MAIYGIKTVLTNQTLNFAAFTTLATPITGCLGATRIQVQIYGGVGALFGTISSCQIKGGYDGTNWDNGTGGGTGQYSISGFTLTGNKARGQEQIIFGPNDSGSKIIPFLWPQALIIFNVAGGTGNLTGATVEVTLWFDASTTYPQSQSN